MLLFVWVKQKWQQWKITNKQTHRWEYARSLLAWAWYICWALTIMTTTRYQHIISHDSSSFTLTGITMDWIINQTIGYLFNIICVLSAQQWRSQKRTVLDYWSAFVPSISANICKVSLSIYIKRHSVLPSFLPWQFLKILPEGVTVGFWNVAWGLKSHKK